MNELTRTQRQVLNEIRSIRRLSGPEDEILDHEPDARLDVLKSIRSTIIRGEVITQATLDEDFVTFFLLGKFLGPHPTFKTKKHRVFQDQVLSRLTFDEKFQICKQLKKHPDRVLDGLSAIHRCRNVIAHNFDSKPTVQKVSYKGRLDIFTLKGFLEFKNDQELVNRYFFRLLWDVSL